MAASAAPLPAGGPGKKVHYQMDVCGLHKSMNNAPTSTLEFDKAKGECTIISRTIPTGPACTANSRDGATRIRMGCKADSSTMTHITGPALNVWATYQGNTPAAVTLERAPATSAITGTCNLTTLSPPLYYHYRVPPMYSYGYALQGLKCQMLTSSNEGVAALSRKSGAGTAATVSGGAIPLNYGLWLVPTLPGPSQNSFSEAPQECKVLMKGASSSFLSTEDFPCKLTPLPQPQLGKGCCYEPMGRRRRQLQDSTDVPSAVVW